MVEDEVPRRTSPFARPPSPTSAPQAPAPPRAPTAAARRDDWRIVKFALIGLAALVAMGLLAMIGRNSPDGLVVLLFVFGVGGIVWFASHLQREGRRRLLERLRQEGAKS